MRGEWGRGVELWGRGGVVGDGVRMVREAVLWVMCCVIEDD